MRAMRNAAAALGLAVVLGVAGHADGNDTDAASNQEASRPDPESTRNTVSTYEKAKGEALDAYISGRLITAYGLSEHLSPFEISVAVKDAKVVLSGAVETKVQRDLALEIARGIEQARTVDSKIRVDLHARRNESAVAQEGFTRNFSDAGITARVKTRLLWNGSTSGLSVDVETDYHAVTLSGTVHSAAESALAELIALNTQGVTRVENRLQITPASDAKLRARRSN